jgi:hypothetical protein
MITVKASQKIFTGSPKARCQWFGENARRLAAPMSLREAWGPSFPQVPVPSARCSSCHCNSVGQ